MPDFGGGADFLGYVLLPHYRQLRTKTRQRIIKKIKQRAGAYQNKKIEDKTLSQSLQSYLGVLSHANHYQFGEAIKEIVESVRES